MKSLDIVAGYSPSRRSDKWLKVIILSYRTVVALYKDTHTERGIEPV